MTDATSFYSGDDVGGIVTRGVYGRWRGMSAEFDIPDVSTCNTTDGNSRGRRRRRRRRGVSFRRRLQRGMQSVVRPI